MPRYMLAVHSVDGEAREPMTDEQMQHSWQEILLGRLLMAKSAS